MDYRNQSDDIEMLRGTLDEVDAELLRLLRTRFDTCLQIGRYKKEHAVPLMQPGRIRVVQDRAAKFAAENGMSEGFVRVLYEAIIAEACRIEAEVLGE